MGKNAQFLHCIIYERPHYQIKGSFRNGVQLLGKGGYLNLCESLIQKTSSMNDPLTDFDNLQRVPKSALENN